MEPSKIRRVDAFEKSYTPNGQNTRVAAPNSPGTMSQRYQRFRSSLHEYGNSASFHGLRFVTDPLANKPRRLVSIMQLNSTRSNFNQFIDFFFLNEGFNF